MPQQDAGLPSYRESIVEDAELALDAYEAEQEALTNLAVDGVYDPDVLGYERPYVFGQEARHNG